MKKDIDSLMGANDVDALLVTGSAQHNPAMVYLTGGAHLTKADLIKKRGHDPVLFYNSMERDEAANTGLETRNLGDYRLHELRRQMDGDLLLATVERYRRMFSDVGVTSGRVAIYGKIESGEAYALFTALQGSLPGITFVGEFENSVLLSAMSTKDEDEVKRIRSMGQKTIEVVDMVADFLTSRRVQDQFLIKSDGSPLTIGDVKKRINLWLAEQSAENPEGTIFAMGYDSGVPHSSGTNSDQLQLGKTIVFDIFPCEAGGGYFYDFTRTWCLGYAPEEAQVLYDDVLAVYKQVMGALQAGTPCMEYQQQTCELFEARGHTTIMSDSQTQQGYVHSIGHGLGLHVHERPSFRNSSGEGDRLEPGVVVTIEPGLYYPQRDMGVRLEDTVWVRPNGEVEVLVEYPLDLVLHMK
jgi:Xaa-Pro aminopeptidase